MDTTFCSGNWWGGFGAISGVLMVLLWVLVIYVIIRILGHGRHYKYHNWYNMGDSSLDIIRTRYAKGEITKEEFEKLKKDLS